MQIGNLLDLLEKYSSNYRAYLGDLCFYLSCGVMRQKFKKQCIADPGSGGRGCERSYDKLEIQMSKYNSKTAPTVN